MNFELKKFRIRWRRFIGQMTRKDRNTWIELLDTQWTTWADNVLKREKFPRFSIDIRSKNLKRDVHRLFNDAIDLATLEELHILDGIYCREFLLTKRV